MKPLTPDIEPLTGELAGLYDIYTQKANGPALELPDRKSLYRLPENDWDRLRYTFQTSFRTFDTFLLKLHYRRGKVKNESQRQKICTFLLIGYVNSNDVRYFNELLFFSEPHSQEVKIADFHFRKLVESQNTHPHPLTTVSEVTDWCEQIQPIETNPGGNKPRIGMLGSPETFQNLYKNLHRDGYPSKCYYFSYETSPLKKLIKKSHLLNRLFFLMRSINVPFESIDEDIAGEAVTKLLTSANLDIGVHALGFIIKNNIIKTFSKGLLNDHLAPLPFVRGKSSVAYTLLFGFPLSATTHFIDEGVDTGPLVKIYTYNKKVLSVGEANQFLLMKSHERLYDSVKLAATDSFTPGINDPGSGLQYFSIHPRLLSYIDQHLLN